MTLHSANSSNWRIKHTQLIRKLHVDGRERYFDFASIFIPFFSAENFCNSGFILEIHRIGPDWWSDSFLDLYSEGLVSNLGGVIGYSEIPRHAVFF